MTEKRLRIDRAAQLFEQGEVIETRPNTFSIAGKPYVVTTTSCSCPDHRYRKIICKHMMAVKAHLGNKRTLNQMDEYINPVPDIKSLYAMSVVYSTIGEKTK